MYSKMAEGTDSSEEYVTEEAIEEMTIMKAYQLCLKYNIICDDVRDMNVMRSLLKGHLLCRDTPTFEEVIEEFGNEASEDRRTIEVLADLYQAAADELSLFHDVNEGKKIDLKQLKDRISAVKEAKAPILIIGETGAGKSSFINLLLGKEWLPTNFLSNTHVICEMMYGENPSANLIGRDSTTIDNIDMKTFQKELEHHVKKVNAYDKAEIYLPCEILKSGLVIVDSPGIDETSEMEKTVFNYATNACAFIFMIKSESAGGLQERMSTFLGKMYNEAVKNQKWFKTDSCIFICNKWDAVPNENKQAVKEDIDAKLQKCKVFEGSNVFPMSTLEASHIQNMTMGRLSPKFSVILQELKRLIPVFWKTVFNKECLYLENIVGDCLHNINSRLSNVGKSKSEKENKYAEIEDRLSTVATDIKYIFDRCKENLASNLEEIGIELQKHIEQKEIKDTVCKFAPKDLPKASDWDHAATEIRMQVYLKIMQEITKWEEKEGLFKETATKITETVIAEFPKFEKEIKNVHHSMAGEAEKEAKDAGEEEYGFLPVYFQNMLKTGDLGKSILLSPIFLFGTILHAPVYGFHSIKKTMETLFFKGKYFFFAYTAEKKQGICEEYAKKAVDYICSSVEFKALIKEDMQPIFQYIDDHQKNLEKTIKADQALLEKIKKDIRSDDEIKQKFEPWKKTFEGLKSRIEDTKTRIKKDNTHKKSP